MATFGQTNDYISGRKARSTGYVAMKVPDGIKISTAITLDHINRIMYCARDYIVN